MASMTATYQTTGGPELSQALTDLGTVLGTKAARAGIKKAMKIVQDEVISSAPVNTVVINGVHLKDNIKIKVSKRTKKMQKKGVDTFLTCSVYTTKAVGAYACAVEFGRNEYSTMRNHFYGTPVSPYEVHVGAVQPNPFMRTALYNNAPQVAQTFIDETFNEIQKMAAKANRKSKQAKPQTFP
ncbi:hypothetical protein CK627_20955 [Aeromonas dhakensis]|uniref:HK97-gp10 family putative phage morphogenesis protein n=1 Tax=Aeromonas dhakensis TaxID=196024 RepID=UPI000BAB1A93|nr:HK97-gp10 family putative phage morphogenesis protein [Aeromonas dhakensis]ASX13079.1 hypothetical protein CK627_20955 [Aeromonas dhakensis]